MASNTDAVEKALRGGLHGVREAIPKAADDVLEQFKVVVSRAGSNEHWHSVGHGGGPPLRESGAYRAGLANKISGDTITIYAKGFQNNKAVWLEFGTRKMAPRPHWRTHLPVIVMETLPPIIATGMVTGEQVA